MDSVLLYEDEKGPLVAKTYGGTILVFHTIQGIQGSKDKRHSKRLWCLMIIPITRCGHTPTNKRQENSSWIS